MVYRVFGLAAREHGDVDAAAAIDDVVAAPPGDPVGARITGDVVGQGSTLGILDVERLDEGAVRVERAEDIFRHEVAETEPVALHDARLKVDVEMPELAMER